MAGTDLVNIEAELQRQAEAITARLATPSGNRIRVTQAKTFKLPDGTEGRGPLDVVIVDFSSANYYYTSPYTENDPLPPACFAIGLTANELAPSANSPDKQAELCAVCPKNQYKTASNGKGKACRNTRQLAVLPSNATEETPIWLLSVSPTAIQSFDKYVAMVSARFNGPPMKVITKIGFDPSVGYASLRFTDPMPNTNLELAFKRQQEAQTLLLQEPDLNRAETSEVAAAPRNMTRKR